MARQREPFDWGAIVTLGLAFLVLALLMLGIYTVVELARNAWAG